MNITQKYLPINTLRRSGIKMDKVLYIIAHDTGSPNATAIQEVNYYIQSSNDLQASAHVFVDDTEALWCIPETEKAWSVRYNAGIAPNLAPHFMNDCGIAVELCYFDDLNRTKLAYSNYVALIAKLCSTHAIDPHSEIVAHADLDPTRRKDPYNVFAILGKTWDNFISDIKVELLKLNQSNQTNNMKTEYVKFYMTGSDIVVTFNTSTMAAESAGQTHGFTSAEDAQSKSEPMVFIFWDNSPIGSGTNGATEPTPV